MTSFPRKPLLSDHEQRITAHYADFFIICIIRECYNLANSTARGAPPSSTIVRVSGRRTKTVQGRRELPNGGKFRKCPSKLSIRLPVDYI